MSLNLNNDFRKKLETATEKLITSLTGFDKANQNHGICLEYAMSHFLHGCYMSTNPRKVKEEILGTADKFEVHAEHVKADQIKKLLPSFLNGTLSDVSFSNSEVHYGMLALLLELSEGSLEKDYKLPVPKPKAQIDGEIDWGAYLMEGIDPPPKWGSSDEEEEEDCGLSTSNYHNTLVQLADSAEDQPLYAINNMPNINDLVSEKPPLKELIAEYWKPSIRTVNNIELFRINKLASSESYQPEQVLLKEYHVMRETIWLLSGCKDMHIFKYENGKFSVAEGTFVSHLTASALKSQLQSVTTRATRLHSLYTFLSSKASSSNLTYEAFTVALRFYLDSFMGRLHDIEKKVVQMSITYLLSDLLTELHDDFAVIDVVSGMFERSIGVNKPNESVAERVSRLLCVLYNALLNERLVCGCGNGKSKLYSQSSIDVLLNMWMTSVKPYIDFVDRWMTRGELLDPNREFALRRLKQFSPDAENATQFWRDAVKLDIANVDEALPWLAPSFDLISVGGKSMEILRTLSVHSSQHRSYISANLCEFYDRNQTPLYTMWVEHIIEMGLIVGEQFKKFTSLPLTTDKHNVGDKGDLLSLSFSMLAPLHEDLLDDKVIVYRICGDAVPLDVTLQSKLAPLIADKSNDASSRLLNLLNDQYGLERVFDDFVNFELMGWGDVMHHFSSAVFRKLSEDAIRVSDLMPLNLAMQDALAGKQQLHEATSRVFVNVDIDAMSLSHACLRSVPHTIVDKKLMAGTDCIELVHEITWPLTLVIGAECRAAYTRIFRYLMKLRHALHCLESLHLPSIYAAERENDRVADDQLTARAKLHRFALLRSRLLHFLRNWRSFVMTHAIDGERRRFERERRGADVRNLDQLMDAHRRFLHRVANLCLLDTDRQSDRLVQANLVKMMTLAVAFARSWSRGAHIVSDETLKRHEKQFTEYSEFFVVILTMVANRQSTPLFETLAYSILG